MKWMSFAMLVALVASATHQAAGQTPVVISVPYPTAHATYHEHFGVGVGWRGHCGGPGGGFFFNNGYGWPGVPFGPPCMGAHFGASGHLGHLGHMHYRWSLCADQGWHQSYVYRSSMLTVTNGYPAYFFSGYWTPFIMSVTPAVFDRPMSPLERTLSDLRAAGKTPADLVSLGPTDPARGESAAVHAPLPPLQDKDDPPLKLGQRAKVGTVSPSREATTGDSLGRESQEIERQPDPESRSDDR